MPGETSLSSLQEVLAQDGILAAEESDSTDLFDFLLITVQSKRLVLGMALAGGLLSAAVVSLLSPTYTATAVIMPPPQQSSAASALLGQLGPIAGLAERDLGIRNPADVYIGILSSRTVADDLIQKYDLQRHYGEKYLMNTRKALAGRSKFSAGKGSITITVEDHDPNLAATFANAYVTELHLQTNRLALTESAQRRLFFERQMQAENKALAEAETALEATQERTGVVQVNAQVEAVIRSLAQLRAEIARREVVLSSLKRAATNQNPEVVRQETELAAMRDQLAKLETRAGKDHSGDPFLPTSEVPKAGLEYVRAVREVKYHETLFELTAKQYEAARLDEAKEAPFIQVVDSAVPPELKSGPHRTLVTAAGFTASGVLGCLFALYRNRLQKDSFRGQRLRRLGNAVIGRAPKGGPSDYK